MLADASASSALHRDNAGVSAGRLAMLGAILAFSLVSTALHYTHNYIEIAHYPQASWISNDTVRVAILIVWPLLTVAGALGFWLYARGLRGAAYAGLIAYSMLGLATLGHFTEGSPHIGAFWYATIFTDAIAGVAVLGFVWWSAFVAGRSSQVAEGLYGSAEGG